MIAIRWIIALHLDFINLQLGGSSEETALMTIDPVVEWSKSAASALKAAGAIGGHNRD